MMSMCRGNFMSEATCSSTLQRTSPKRRDLLIWKFNKGTSYCLSPEGGERGEDNFFLGEVTWFTGGTLSSICFIGFPVVSIKPGYWQSTALCKITCRRLFSLPASDHVWASPNGPFSGHSRLLQHQQLLMTKRYWNTWVWNRHFWTRIRKFCQFEACLSERDSTVIHNYFWNG